jgi:hypothetical protein
VTILGPASRLDPVPGREPRNHQPGILWCSVGKVEHLAERTMRSDRHWPYDACVAERSCLSLLRGVSRLRCPRDLLLKAPGQKFSQDLQNRFGIGLIDTRDFENFRFPPFHR